MTVVQADEVCCGLSWQRSKTEVSAVRQSVHMLPCDYEMMWESDERHMWKRTEENMSKCG